MQGAPPIPRINSRGFVVGDQQMRLIHMLRLPASVAVGSSRGELLDSLCGLLRSERLYASPHAAELAFTEHRISAIPLLVAASTAQGFVDVPYGLLFEKQWMILCGARRIQGADKGPGVSKSGNRQLTEACPSSRWRVGRRSLSFSPSNTKVLVPDRVAAAALAVSGFSKWRVVALEDYLQPGDRHDLILHGA